MVGGIFCDIQKAFDCVNYDTLLAKLDFYGITGITYIRLMNHLETNNIPAAEQFGFRTSSSTELASFNFINNILNEFQKKKKYRRYFL